MAESESAHELFDLILAILNVIIAIVSLVFLIQLVRLHRRAQRDQYEFSTVELGQSSNIDLLRTSYCPIDDIDRCRDSKFVIYISSMGLISIWIASLCGVYFFLETYYHGFSDSHPTVHAALSVSSYLPLLLSLASIPFI